MWSVECSVWLSYVLCVDVEWSMERRVWQCEGSFEQDAHSWCASSHYSWQCIEAFMDSGYFYFYTCMCLHLLCPRPHPIREGGQKHCFCPSIRPSIHLPVHPFVVYIVNNLRTQMPSVHLRFDSHTSFKIKRSKVKVTRPVNADTHCVPYLPNGN